MKTIKHKESYLIQFTSPKFLNQVFAVYQDEEARVDGSIGKFRPVDLSKDVIKNSQVIIFSNIDAALDFKKEQEISDNEAKIIRLDSVKLKVGQGIVLI